MSSVKVNYLQQKAALVASARKYHIPYGILAGVYGAETRWGNNVSTSSAGAVGPFQFISSTAASYGYPLTNDPSPQQFVAQADAAAHYLSDLYARDKSWETALRGYSGGGYGLAHVDALDVQLQQGSGAYSGGGVSPSAAILGGSLAGAAAIIGAAGAGADAVAAGTDAVTGAPALGSAEADTSAAEAAAAGGAGGYATKGLSDLASLAKAGGLAALLVDPHFLVRAAKIIGGFLLILLGLRELANAAGANIPGPTRLAMAGVAA